MAKIMVLLAGSIFVLGPLVAHGQLIEPPDPSRWVQVTNKIPRPISTAQFGASWNLPSLAAEAETTGDGSKRWSAMWVSPLPNELRLSNLNAKPPTFGTLPDERSLFQKALAWQGDYHRRYVLTLGRFASLSVGWNRLSTSVLSRLKAAVTLGASKPTNPVIFATSPRWPAVTTQEDWSADAATYNPVTLNWRIDRRTGRDTDR